MYDYFFKFSINNSSPAATTLNPIGPTDEDPATKSMKLPGPTFTVSGVAPNV